MKIRTRLLYLLVLLVVIFLTIFIIQKIYNQHRLNDLLRSVQSEQEAVFDKISGLMQKPLQTFVYDYSWWGEMASFVTTADKKWAADNIDLSLGTYQANAAWVYDPDYRLVYSTNNLEEKAGLIEVPIPRQALRSLFARSHFCHFFVNTPQGLMEFNGASIHDADDVQREHSPRGYLFCSRLWSKNYVAELAELTGTTVTLLDPAVNRAFKPGKDEVYFSRELLQWDNQPAKYLMISATSAVLSVSRKSADQAAVLFFVFCVVVLGMVVFFLFHWINLPLRLITLALEKGESSHLSVIKKQNSEFGEVSRMIDKFFRQNDEIVREIAERKQVQEALNMVNQCFSFFEPDPDKNIQLLTETAGKVLGAKCMLYNYRRGEFLDTIAGWNLPADFPRSSLGRGHICSEVIEGQYSQLVVIRELGVSKFAQTDPRVSKYNLKSYIAYPVRVGGQTVGSLCALFDRETQAADDYHLNLLQVLGRAISVEEGRRQTDKVLRDQALELDNALKEALKSREILLSMLEDNQLNKLRLEASVQELALAYSKLEKSQEEVIQAAKFGAIGQLASSVAHEVRNPLAIIMQSIEYLENKVPAAHREIIQVAANNIKRANTIVGTLLDFSKAKKLNLEPEDVNFVLADSLKLTQFSNIKNKVVVIREFEPQLPKVLIDRQKIEQVFVNILLNAMQAMPEGGNLYVRTYLMEFDKLPEAARKALAAPELPLNEAVNIEIQDEGVGIPEENMESIFRPFFTTKGAMTGIGLGLSVVKDIIEIHKGYIDISSKVNAGTKVTITLKVI